MLSIELLLAREFNSNGIATMHVNVDPLTASYTQSLQNSLFLFHTSSSYHTSTTTASSHHG
jgi:hypothetical protein